MVAHDRACTPLPRLDFHGKEGVDGSSPSEGSKIPAKWGFLLPELVQESTSLIRSESMNRRFALAGETASSSGWWPHAARAARSGDRFWGRPARRGEPTTCQSCQRPECSALPARWLTANIAPAVPSPGSGLRGEESRLAGPAFHRSRRVGFGRRPTNPRAQPCNEPNGRSHRIERFSGHRGASRLAPSC